MAAYLTINNRLLWLATHARPAPAPVQWSDCPEGSLPICHFNRIGHQTDVTAIAYSEPELFSWKCFAESHNHTHSWFFAEVTDLIEVSNLDRYLPGGQVARALAELDKMIEL